MKKFLLLLIGLFCFNIHFALAQKTMIIGVYDTHMPIVFRDINGNLVGFDIDLSTEVMNRLGLPFQYKMIDWAEKEKVLLKDKTIDMIWVGMTVTDERKKTTCLANPILGIAKLFWCLPNQIFITKKIWLVSVLLDTVAVLAKEFCWTCKKTVKLAPSWALIRFRLP